MSRNSSTVETLESLQEVLQPLEVLQTEQAELGSWIHDSFSALEKLHEELTQWQSELARKETELDLRQDAVSKAKSTDKGLQKQMTQLEQKLAVSQEEQQQLEEENAEQLQELEGLEARFTDLEAQFDAARQRNTELEATLEAERKRSSNDVESFHGEFQALRSDLEKYFQLLSGQLDKIDAVTQDVVPGHESHTPLSAGAAHAKSAELRRRARSRREAKVRQNHPDDK